MKLKIVFGIIPAAVLLLAACEQDGPMENAGEQADDAVENFKDAVDGENR